MPPLPMRAGSLVLLVDDHEDTREMYTIFLREVGGLAMVENVTPANALARAVETRPDVVVADHRMIPVDGLQLCEQLRAHPETKDIPVIMLTGYAPSADVERIRALCAAVLVKPCDPDALVAEIRRVIDRASAERAAES